MFIFHTLMCPESKFFYVYFCCCCEFKKNLFFFFSKKILYSVYCAVNNAGTTSTYSTRIMYAKHNQILQSHMVLWWCRYSFFFVVSHSNLNRIKCVCMWITSPDQHQAQHSTFLLEALTEAMFGIGECSQFVSFFFSFRFYLFIRCVVMALMLFFLNNTRIPLGKSVKLTVYCDSLSLRIQCDLKRRDVRCVKRTTIILCVFFFIFGAKVKESSKAIYLLLFLS